MLSSKKTTCHNEWKDSLNLLKTVTLSFECGQKQKDAYPMIGVNSFYSSTLLPWKELMSKCKKVITRAIYLFTSTS